MAATPATPVGTPDVEPAPDDVEAPVEGLRYLDNGMVIAYVDGKRFLFRRPKSREYKAMREALEQHQDEITELAEAATEANRAAVVEAGEDQPSLAARKVMRERNRELTRTIAAGRRSWLRQVFATLGDKPLEVDDDDLPVWFGSDEPPLRLLAHWQRVPSLRGGR